MSWSKRSLPSVAFVGSPILYHTYFFTDHPMQSADKRSVGIMTKTMSISGLQSGKILRGSLKPIPPLPCVDANARVNSLGSFPPVSNSSYTSDFTLKQDLDNMELLSKYKVLYLADIATDNKQLANITRFVENGVDCDDLCYFVYDEHGEKRSDFALANCKDTIP